MYRVTVANRFSETVERAKLRHFAEDGNQPTVGLAPVQVAITGHLSRQYHQNHGSAGIIVAGVLGTPSLVHDLQYYYLITKAQVEFSDLMGPSSETPISLFLLRSKCWFANENEQAK